MDANDEPRLPEIRIRKGSDAPSLGEGKQQAAAPLASFEALSDISDDSDAEPGTDDAFARSDSSEVIRAKSPTLGVPSEKHKKQQDYNAKNIGGDQHDSADTNGSSATSEAEMETAESGYCQLGDDDQEEGDGGTLTATPPRPPPPTPQAQKTPSQEKSDGTGFDTGDSRDTGFEDGENEPTINTQLQYEQYDDGTTSIDHVQTTTATTILDDFGFSGEPAGVESDNVMTTGSVDEDYATGNLVGSEESYEDEYRTETTTETVEKIKITLPGGDKPRSSKNKPPRPEPPTSTDSWVTFGAEESGKSKPSRPPPPCPAPPSKATPARPPPPKAGAKQQVRVTIQTAEGTCITTETFFFISFHSSCFLFNHCLSLLHL